MPASPLHRLHQEGDGVRCDGAGKRVGVAEGDGAEAGREGTEAVAILVLGREADDRDGAAMEVVGADQDLRLPGGDALDQVAPLACGFERSFDCLNA